MLLFFKDTTRYITLTFAILGLIQMGSSGNAAEDDPAETESIRNALEPLGPEPGVLEPAVSKPIVSNPSLSKDASTDKEYDLSKVFKNDFSEVLKPDAEPQITIAIQRFQPMPGGATHSYTQHQSVDWKSGNLSPEQCLGVVVHQCEKSIRELRQKLESKNSPDDEDAKEGHLKELKRMYALRFDLDTAYQDFKVSQVEARAKKLRAEVQAREQASEKWVDAMITLAKMKADGIAVAEGYAGPTPIGQTVGVSMAPGWGGPKTTTRQTLPDSTPVFSSRDRSGFGLPNSTAPVNRTPRDARSFGSSNSEEGYRSSRALRNTPSNGQSFGRAPVPLPSAQRPASFQPPQPPQPQRLQPSLPQPSLPQPTQLPERPSGFDVPTRKQAQYDDSE